MKRTFLPNTFQKPNWMTDELNYLLSGDEVKVMDHVTRHILGWTNRISTRTARLSLSHICEGYTTDDGARFYGTGLNEKTARAILLTLCDFGLLERTAENDPRFNQGAEYRLPEAIDEENIQRLRDRREARVGAQKVRASAGMAAMKAPAEGGPIAGEVLPSHGTTPLPSHGRGVLPSHGGQQTQVKPTLNPQGASAPRAESAKPKTDPITHAMDRRAKVEAEGRHVSLLRQAARPGQDAAVEMCMAFADLTQIKPVNPRDAAGQLAAAAEMVAGGCTIDDMRAAWRQSQDKTSGFQVTDLHSLKRTARAIAAERARTKSATKTGKQYRFEAQPDGSMRRVEVVNA